MRRGPNKGDSYKYNFHELKKEWLTTGESVKAFALRKGINRTTIGAEARRANWYDQRQLVRKKATDIFIDSLSKQEAKLFRRDANLTEDLLDQIESALAKTKDDEGKIVRPLRPGDLASISASLERVHRQRRLMSGKPTEINENRNIHADLVDLLAKQREEDGA